MKKDKFEIKIDMTDELEQALKRETDVSSVEALLEENQVTGLSVYTLASDSLVLDEYKSKPDSDRVLGIPKYLLKVGAAGVLSQKFAALKREAKMPNGTKREIRATVATVREDTVESDMPFSGVESAECEQQDERQYDYRFHNSDTQLAFDNAYAYLVNTVPGYIMGRLEIIAANGTKEDVIEAGKVLKAKIDLLVAQLVE